MTDVLKIALDRRAELEDEISKLDGFIRMAEELIRASKRRVGGAPADNDGEAMMQQRPARVQEPVVRSQSRRGASEDEDAGPSRPQVIRRASAAGNN